MRTTDHLTSVVCEELTIAAAPLNGHGLLSVRKKDFVDGTELLVLENHFVAVVDYIVYHLSISDDLVNDLSCGFGFSFEIDIHLFLVICFVVEICLEDAIYLSFCPANVIDIGPALLTVIVLVAVIDHQDFVLGGENPTWNSAYLGLEKGRFFGFLMIRE